MDRLVRARLDPALPWLGLLTLALGYLDLARGGISVDRAGALGLVPVESRPN